MLLGGFFLYVSYYGTDQSQVQRLLSAKDLKTVKTTLLANGLLRFPITFAYCLMGLVIGVLAFSNTEFMAQIPSDRPDFMIPVFIKSFLPHGIIGILLVAILSAAMSSLSSAVNSLSAASLEDFILRGKSVESKDYIRYSRMTTLVWGIICIVLAFFAGNIAKTVIEAINKIGSVFYGPIIATFLAAVAFKRVHALGINIGLITGVLVNVCLWQFQPDIFWFWWNAIGAGVTLSLGLLISTLIPQPVQSGFSLEFSATDFKDWRIYALLSFFVLIILFSTLLPGFF